MLNAVALYDCIADEEGELSFTEGTKFIDVIESAEEGWLEGCIEGTSQRGLFPNNYVRLTPTSNLSPKTSPSPAKPIPQSHLTGESTTVSPSNSAMSSSWSVISNTIPSSNISLSNNVDNNHNAFYSALKLSNNKTNDAFDTIMQNNTSLSQNNNPPYTKPNLPTRTTPSPPVTTSTRIKTEISNLNNNNNNINNNNNSNNNNNNNSQIKPSASNFIGNSSFVLSEKKGTFVLPSLKSTIQNEQTVNRTRSFSTSSNSSSTLLSSSSSSSLSSPKLDDSTAILQKPSMIYRGQEPKIIKPQFNIIKPKTSSPPSISSKPSELKTTELKSSNDAVNLFKTETNNNSLVDDDDLEEEDGYQLVKPSQLRKRQQQQQQQQNDGSNLSNLFNNKKEFIVSPNTSSSSILYSSKSSITPLTSKSLTPTSSITTKVTPISSVSTRLEVLPSTSTINRLPSRPVSAANRRSKAKISSSSSTNTSTPSTVSKNNNNNDNKLLSPSVVKNINNTTLSSSLSNINNKPQINVNSKPTSIVNNNKNISINNININSDIVSINNNNNNNSNNNSNNKSAPNIKPKPVQLNQLNSKLISSQWTSPEAAKKIVINKKERSASNPPPIQPKKIFLNEEDNNNRFVKQVNGNNDKSIMNTLEKKTSAPILPVRKPSIVTTTVNIKNDKDNNNDNTDFLTKNKSSDDNNSTQLLKRGRSSTIPNQFTRPKWEDDENNKKNGESVIATATTKSTFGKGAIRSPPPPPTSRQVVGNIKNRYEILFDKINDDGYVDGMTAKLIWTKSRLPNEVLAKIWDKQPSVIKTGLLDKKGFMDGMQQIDLYLSQHQ